MTLRILSFTILLILTTISVFGQLIDHGSVKLKAQDQLIEEYNWLPQEYNETLSMGLSNFYYEVSEFGWSVKGIPFVKIPEHYYAGVLNESGFADMMMLSIDTGYFNDDDYQDFVLAWYIMPHVTTREGLLSTFTVYLNNKDDSFSELDFDTPLRYMPYRPSTGDFNGDGLDDIVTTSMIKVTECYEDLSCNNLADMIPLVLSDNAGKYFDQSSQISGQENGTPINSWKFGHDLSVGDVNADGLDDFYTGKHLFLNGKNELFNVFHDSLPDELKPNHLIMSSAIGDLNGDGYGDIISMHGDDESTEDPRGYVWMSNGSDFSKRVVFTLPEGRYENGTENHGPTQTKYNDAILYDIDNDGVQEIIVAVTRRDPYYVGSHLQIFKYNDSGFLDITDEWVDFPTSFEQQHGAGRLYTVDVNNDEIIDIVHQLNDAKVQIYLNDGQQLHIQPFLHLPENDEPYGLIPHVREFQVQGHHSDSPFYWDEEPFKSFPVNIDNKNGVDFIRGMGLPALNDPEANMRQPITLYSVINKKPLKFSPPEGEIKLVGPVDGETYKTNFVHFEWESNSTVDYYRVEITTDSSDFKLTPYESFINTKTYIESTSVVFDSLDTQLTYYWRVRGENNMGTTEFSEVRSFTTGTLTSVGVDDPSTLPVEYSLNQNYPNPFNPTTTISYSLPQSGMVTLNVYDITGKYITTLVNGVNSAGIHTVTFDAGSLSSGMYVYTLETDGYRQTRQMMLVK